MSKNAKPSQSAGGSTSKSSSSEESLRSGVSAKEDAHTNIVTSAQRSSASKQQLRSSTDSGSRRARTMSTTGQNTIPISNNNNNNNNKNSISGRIDSILSKLRGNTQNKSKTSQQSSRKVAMSGSANSSSSSGTTTVATPVRRIDSEQSIASMGIGGVMRGKMAANFDLQNHPVRLYPEGDIPSGHTIYDCIVYLFFCGRHDRFAVTTGRAVWWPFVAMESGVTYMKAAKNKIGLFLGRRDRAAKLIAAPESRSGSGTALGTGTVEQDIDSIGKLPPYRSYHVHEMRCQLPSGRGYTRIVHLVDINPEDIRDPDYVCCEPTPKLTWLRTADILDDQVESLWAPEVKLCILIAASRAMTIEDFNREHALQLLTCTDRSIVAAYHIRLLHAAKINTETLTMLFEDYVEHCFPATLMGFESFKSYLIKWGWNREDARFMWIFYAAGYNGRGFLDFNEFVVALVCLEPGVENGDARHRLLFRYYDIDRNDRLDLSEFLTLLSEANPKATREQLRAMLDAASAFGFSETSGITYDAFHRAIIGGKIRGTTALCRSPCKIIPKILSAARKRLIDGSSSSDRSYPTNSFTFGGGGGGSIGGGIGPSATNRTKEAVSGTSATGANGNNTTKTKDGDNHASESKPENGTTEGPSSGGEKQHQQHHHNRRFRKSTDRLCSGCRPKDLEWCMHTLRLDPAGAAQKPERIIDLNWSPDDPTVSLLRYSAEFVFSLQSMFRWFTDTIRSLYTSSSSLLPTFGGGSSFTGLMASPEEAGNFASYAQSLCAHVGELLLAEDRLIRCNAPTVVIGDLRGRLSALLHIERMLFPSLPVMKSDFIFLGNYIGDCVGGVGGAPGAISSTNVEVLCYLFALKMMAPNRVHLLRGASESRDDNRDTLLVECRAKYGNDYGNFVWEQLNFAMDRLPIAAIIDETIICVHSGVPKTTTVGKIVSSLDEIPEVIQHLEKESPLAYQIIYNIPSDSDNSLSDKRLSELPSMELGFERNLNKLSPHHHHPRDHHRRSKKLNPNLGSPGGSSSSLPGSTDDASPNQSSIPIGTHTANMQSSDTGNPAAAGGGSFDSNATQIPTTLSSQFEYNQVDFQNFLIKNSLTHLIRSHETPKDGYRLLFGARCVTISATGDDRTTVAFVDSSDCTIRLIRLLGDTGNGGAMMHTAGAATANTGGAAGGGIAGIKYGSGITE